MIHAGPARRRRWARATLLTAAAAMTLVPGPSAVAKPARRLTAAVLLPYPEGPVSVPFDAQAIREIDRLLPKKLPENVPQPGCRQGVKVRFIFNLGSVEYGPCNYPDDVTRAVERVRFLARCRDVGSCLKTR